MQIARSFLDSSDSNILYPNPNRISDFRTPLTVIWFHDRSKVLSSRLSSRSFMSSLTEMLKCFSMVIFLTPGTTMVSTFSRSTQRWDKNHRVGLKTQNAAPRSGACRLSWCPKPGGVQGQKAMKPVNKILL